MPLSVAACAFSLPTSIFLFDSSECLECSLPKRRESFAQKPIRTVNMDIPSSPARPEALRVLSFDGGGVKGLASLLILQRVFRTLQRLEDLPDLPRPCEYFDLIGGTSTGG